MLTSEIWGLAVLACRCKPVAKGSLELKVRVTAKRSVVLPSHPPRFTTLCCTIWRGKKLGLDQTAAGVPPVEPSAEGSRRKVAAGKKFLQRSSTCSLTGLTEPRQAAVSKLVCYCQVLPYCTVKSRCFAPKT